MNADQLRQAMAKLPEPVTDKKPPFWEYWRRELWEQCQENDPVEFMKWPCIRHTMLVNHWSMEREWTYLLQSDTYRWPKVILPHSGFPKDYFGPTPYSNNMINQAYHVALWESTTGKRIDQLDTIIEFGGGYGAMALLCWRLGFRGKYIIYDLPEFSLLQQWFLSQEGVENVAWPKRSGKAVRGDLLIALYSLSEIPPVDRSRFLIKATVDSYLFLYSPTWEEYDNETYFKEFAKAVDLKWYSQPTPRQTDSYLIGW
jgi:hypothetical protein